MTKVIIVCGSLRKASFTRALTDIAFAHAKRIVDADYLDLARANVEWFRGWGEEYGADTRRAVAKLVGSDVLIIGVPIYDGLLSSPLKNLFEHVDYKALEGKVAGFIVKSGRMLASLQVHGQLVALMNYFRVVSNPRAVYACDEHFDEKGRLKDREIEARVKGLVNETVGMFHPKKG